MYDLSAALYIEGVFQATGERLDFAFLAMEKDAPYTPALYRAPEAMILSGMEKFRNALRLVQQCQSKGAWPGYQTGSDFEDLEWPRFA